jgi:hypothetical protein
MRKCYPNKKYCVSLNKIIQLKDGWKNYIETPRLAQARYYAKKLKLKYRQIDVREHGKKPYVLNGSWL